MKPRAPVQIPEQAQLFELTPNSKANKVSRAKLRPVSSLHARAAISGLRGLLDDELPAKLGLSKRRAVDLFKEAKAKMPTEDEIASQLVLDVFEAPIVFHRILVDVCGSVTAALFLSQIIASDQTLHPDQKGWIDRSIEDWQKDTGLSPFEQRTARRVLRDLGLLDEYRDGEGQAIRYRLNHQALLSLTQNVSTQRCQARHNEAMPAPAMAFAR